LHMCGKESPRASAPISWTTSYWLAARLEVQFCRRVQWRVRLIVAVAELPTHPRRAPFDGLFDAEQIAPQPRPTLPDEKKGHPAQRLEGRQPCPG
jgi:hypothetical protein